MNIFYKKLVIFLIYIFNILLINIFCCKYFFYLCTDNKYICIIFLRDSSKFEALADAKPNNPSPSGRPHKACTYQVDKKALEYAGKACPTR